MANLQSQIDILAKAVVKEHINLEDYKLNNKGSVTLSEVSNKIDVYNSAGEVSILGGGDKVDYKEESYKLEVSVDGNPSTTTMFTYDEDHNFSGFLFYDNANKYMVNDRGEIIGNNSLKFGLEKESYVRRIGLNVGEISETQSDKNKNRMVYVNKEILVDDVGILYNEDKLNITKSSNEDDWKNKYYVEFIDSNNNKIQLIVEIVINGGNISGSIIEQIGSNYNIDNDNIEITDLGVSFDIIDSNGDIVYAYRSRNIGAEEFKDKITLLAIHLTSDITEIGYNAFSGCSKLKQVQIPNIVTTIGNNAFYNCTSLEQVTIPDNVTIMGNEVFSGCSKLKQVKISNNIKNIGYNTFYNCTSLEQITIPDNVTIMGNEVFSGCSKLKQVKISNNIKNIGYNTFYNCTSLEQITIPDNVTSIDNGAFKNCTELTQVTISDNLTIIGYNAFSGCSKLKQVQIPNIVTTIGNNAFYNCTSLEQVTIPDNVTIMGNEVFSGCSGLTKVTISDNLTTIANSAFQNCEALTQVTIPDKVTEIGESAFEGCISLTNIYIKGSPTIFGSNAFNTGSELTIYCNPYTESTIKSYYNNINFERLE